MKAEVSAGIRPSPDRLSSLMGIIRLYTEGDAGRARRREGGGGTAVLIYLRNLSPRVEC